MYNACIEPLKIGGVYVCFSSYMYDARSGREATYVPLRLRSIGLFVQRGKIGRITLVAFFRIRSTVSLSAATLITRLFTSHFLFHQHSQNSPRSFE
jgi:hypothetical protein